MKQKGSITLACFSPPVMVATFLIEIFLAVFVLAKYRLNKISGTILALLVCLGAFQLAEYYVCTNSSGAIGASRAGYVAITLLPPLGLYLMSLLTKRLSKATMIAAFAATAGFVGYFLLAPDAFRDYQCTGNYVIFQIGIAQAMAYGAFYYGTILLTIWNGMKFLKENSKAKTLKAVRWLLAGYAFFIVPVAVIIVVQPDTRDAIPSILCGFAVTMAVTLAMKVAPLSLKKR